jgi:hypothetical protein
MQTRAEFLERQKYSIRGIATRGKDRMHKAPSVGLEFLTVQRVEVLRKKSSLTGGVDQPDIVGLQLASSRETIKIHSAAHC